MLADGRRRRCILKRCLPNGVKSRKVDPLQPESVVQELGGLQQLDVTLAGRSDHELAGRTWPAPTLVLADLFDPLQPLQQVRGEPLSRRNSLQPLRGGGLQVDADPVSERHGPRHLIVLGARHDLEMDITAEIELLAQDFGRRYDLVLGHHAIPQNARRQKDPLHQPRPIEAVKTIRHLVGRKRDPPCVPIAT